MIRITNLTIARGAKRLLEGASLTVHPGHKLGIVGANGSGKSSLFAALRNELIPDAGSIDIPAAWTIAHVAQETPPVATSALDYVLDGDAELRSIEQALAAAEPDPAHSGEALADLHHRFEIVGGYSAPARAATLPALRSPRCSCCATWGCACPCSCPERVVCGGARGRAAHGSCMIGTMPMASCVLQHRRA